jgi:hypothetical protein
MIDRPKLGVINSEQFFLGNIWKFLEIFLFSQQIGAGILLASNGYRSG